MRILWIGHNLAYPPVRGVLMRNFNLLRETAKHYELHVLAFDQPQTRPSGTSAEDCAVALRKFCTHVEWVPLFSDFSKSKHWLGVHGLISNKAYDLNWFASKTMVKQLKLTLDKLKFDVVHFDTLGLAPYRKYVSGAGTVLNHHNIESSMMKHRAETEMRRIPRVYWRWEANKLLQAERKYCPQFDVNLVVSPEDGSTLSELIPGIKTRTVPNGVDTEYFTPRTDPGGSTLLFCGGLDWYPNAEAMSYFFEEIWPKLKIVRPDIRIVVVGRNPPKWLSNIATADRRIEVTGFVNDVRPYFKEATAYFCPIRVGGGTRLKILDALAMGMPLIGTTFSCSGISVQNEKNVLLADTPEEFIKQINRVLADPLLRTELAKRGRELVCQQYSWSVIGESISQAYREASFLTTKQ
jgi:polysaccharide biosynthesis protein PslH